MLNKKLMILTIILACLLTVSTVNAVENVTSDVVGVDCSSNVVSVDDNNRIIDSYADNNDDVISLSDDSNEIFTADYNNDDVISLSDDSNEIFAMDSNDDVISIGYNDNDILTASDVENDKFSSWGYSPADDFTQSKTDYKTFYLGLMKIPKKYKKFAYGYKPLKKYKNAWKKYKAYKKIEKRQLKKFKKSCIKVMRKGKSNHWNFLTYNIIYKIKYRGKYMYIKYYCDAYRTFNYNALLNKAWWD